MSYCKKLWETAFTAFSFKGWKEVPVFQPVHRQFTGCLLFVLRASTQTASQGEPLGEKVQWFWTIYVMSFHCAQNTSEHDKTFKVMDLLVVCQGQFIPVLKCNKKSVFLLCRVTAIPRSGAGCSWRWSWKQSWNRGVEAWWWSRVSTNDSQEWLSLSLLCNNELFCFWFRLLC